MPEPLTEDLLEELLESPDPKDFVSRLDHAPQTLSEYLNRMLEEKGLRRSDVIRNAGMNETFGYQVFVGTRKASRDNLLKIAFAMRLDLKEASRLLQVGQKNALYCKVRRDAILIFALDNGYTLQEVEEVLYRFDEETMG